jgi:hypothetical protein
VSNSSDKDVDAAYWFDHARNAAQNPEGWRYAAEMLKVGADKLLDAHMEARAKVQDAFLRSGGEVSELLADMDGGPFLTPIYLMLSGLAIENLAKGIAVARNPQHGEPNAKGEVVAWGHLSRDLLTGLRIKVDADDGALVDRLSLFVEWAGRYPVARSVARMSFQQQLHFTYPVDRDAIDALFQRLDEELGAALPLHLERRERELLKRGVEAYSRLEVLPTEESDGVAYFVDEGEAPQGWVATNCVACRKQINLGARTPAALCGCGDFHYAWIWWDGALQRTLPGNDVLPASQIPRA